MKQEKKQKVIKAVFIVVGVLLILDTVFVRTRSNWNLGVVLPALLGIPLLLYGIFKQPFDRWFQSKLGKFVKWFFICGYAFLIVLTVVMSIQMVSAARKEPPEGAQAVIVLGAGIKGDQVSYALQNRLDAAAAYYAENPDAVIVVSGGYGQGKEYSEAEVMEQYLIDAGVPPEAVVKEDSSTSTNENFRYSKEILDERLGDEYTVVYVTNDFHILRAGINAKDEGLSDAHGLSSPTPLFIIPNCYLREALALLSTCVFGTS